MDVTPLLGKNRALPPDWHCPACGHDLGKIGQGTATHAASISCASCGRWLRWLRKSVVMMMVGEKANG